MSGRIPPDALEYYVSLGADRSYEKVADHYGVSKRAVTKLAVRQRWQEFADTCAFKTDACLDWLETHCS